MVSFYGLILLVLHTFSWSENSFMWHYVVARKAGKSSSQMVASMNNGSRLWNKSECVAFSWLSHVSSVFLRDLMYPNCLCLYVCMCVMWVNNLEIQFSFSWTSAYRHNSWIPVTFRLVSYIDTFEMRLLPCDGWWHPMSNTQKCPLEQGGILFRITCSISVRNKIFNYFDF